MNKAIFFILTTGAMLSAQEPAPPPPHLQLQLFEPRLDGPSGNVMYQMGTPIGGLRQMAVQYIGAESGLPGDVVKGKPYSAESVSETTQTLGDGNRIRNTNSSHVYRDADGRTRREPALGALGLAPDVPVPQLVFINDPVAGVHYVLDLKERTAQKMKLFAPTPDLAELKTKILEMKHAEAGTTEARPTTLAVAGVAGEAVAVPAPGTVHAMALTRASSMEGGKTESLGRQTMEGVEADGTRTTFTIAAGEIGNDRPIEIVSERWYSQELQTVVMSRHSDPRMGETVFRLTNISRTDQPRSLFEPPADFKVNEGKADVFRMRVPPPPPPK